MEKLKIKATYKIVENEEKQGIELYFEAVPDYNDRQELKTNGFKWNNAKKCWYIKKNAIGNKTKKEANKKQIEVKHSLKEGDILYSSWGYEQTNNTFFRVEKLIGFTMVRLREVYLKVQERKSTGMDAEDRIYDQNSWSYNENKEEITKKVKNYDKDKKPECDFVDINSFMNAYKYNGQKLYCSWYY